jgi:hypothetical protein
VLFRGDGLFFRTDDTIILDLNALDMGIVETKFGELSIVYRDEIYPTLRNRTYEAEAKNLAPSPMPEFMYRPDKSSIKDRRFTWELTTNFVIPEGFTFEGTFTSAPQKLRTIPQKGVQSDVVRLEELKKENAILRASELDKIKKLYDDKIITREMYAQLVKVVYDKFSRGGDV